jgi:hypothetical protein
MERRGGLSPQADVEEIDSAGDKVMVVVHTPRASTSSAPARPRTVTTWS